MAAACVSLAAAAKGVAEWNSLKLNLGVLESTDAEATGSLWFVNTGDEPLYITQVRPTCGCTDTDHTRSEIAPGDTGRVVLKFNAHGTIGKFSKGVYVYTSDSEQRTTLRIEGIVKPTAQELEKRYPYPAGPLRLSRAINAMGKITKGANKMSYLTGINAGDDSVKISFRDVPGHIEISSIPEIAGPGEKVTIPIYFDTNSTSYWGYLADSLTVVAEPLGKPEQQGSVRAEVSGVVVDDFSKLSKEDLDNAPIIVLEQDVADFGVVESNSKAECAVGLKNCGKTPLLVRDVYCEERGISIGCDKGEIAPGGSATITVKADTAKLEYDMIIANAYIICNDPSNSQVFLRVAGEIKKK